MEHLYAPWRSKYTGVPSQDSCPFCISPERDDDAKRYILQRYEHCYTRLNIYPYNAGHLMVIPYTHTPALPELTQETRSEIINVASLCQEVLSEQLQTHGFNIGLNIGGKIAGGTIPEHLHLHVLPRFLGDTNFLPVLSGTKQISVDLNGLYTQLIDAFMKRG